MTKRPPLTEPVIVAEFWANRRGESVRIQLREFEGLALVDLRRHYTNADGKMAPTKKGISIAVTRLPDLNRAVAKALQKARELGLLGNEAAS
jgi:Transcriptional Coactivator p15 (PC4)